MPAQTDPGIVMGTAGYMSPEQVRGQTADARSDIFSFGCVLYEMVTGRRAFQRETAAETMTAILHDEPQEPTKSGQQVPVEVGRVIRQCLAKTPNQRLQSARDLAIGLRATASDPALQRLPAARRVSWRLLGVPAAVLVIGVIGVSVYLLTRGDNRSQVGKPAEEAKVEPPKPAEPPKPPPPPPIPLKYYGFAGTPQSGARRAFFLDGDDIFAADLPSLAG